MTMGESKGKAAEIVRLPPPILAHPSKKVLEKSKFFGKRKNTITKTKMNTRQLYAQVANLKVTNILKLKENYLNLSVRKIKNIYRIINDIDKTKLHIKITIKGLSQKQVIVPMDRTNVDKIMISSSIYITNINKALKNIKSDVIVNYV